MTACAVPEKGDWVPLKNVFGLLRKKNREKNRDFFWPRSDQKKRKTKITIFSGRGAAKAQSRTKIAIFFSHGAAKKNSEKIA